MKVAVCVPHTGIIRAKCAQALNALVSHSLSRRVRYNGEVVQPKLAFFYMDGGPLEYKRTALASSGLEWGADYLLLIDSDQTFPPDGLLRFARHNLAFVAANYPERHGTALPTAISEQGRPVPKRQGVEQVGAVGLGFALIKAQVFNAIQRPWFQSEIDDSGKLVRGEDVHFCNQARRAGIPVHVDHDLIVGHIAEAVLTLEGEDANAHSVLSATGAE